MWWIVIGSAVIYGFYLVLVSIFYKGWRQIAVFVPKGDEVIRIKISVIVACRNEKNHIRQLISCLAQQSFQEFELIIINDHSVDATRNYIKSAQETYPKIQLVDAAGFGKKNALIEGINISTGDLIITTDADCLPSYHWLESIACFYDKNPCDLIICPVKFSGKDNLFSNLQSLEFTSLIASGAGAAGAGMPVLCNGANLAFAKKSWKDSRSCLHEEEMSGDDMFLLESIKKRKGVIRFLKSESAFVTTQPSGTLIEFIKQRRRWASKSSAYTDWQIIFTAGIVFLVNLEMVTLLMLSFVYPACFFVFVALFLAKSLLDTFFLNSVKTFFQLNNVWIYSFLLSVIYPFYIVFIAISTLLVKPDKWK